MISDAKVTSAGQPEGVTQHPFAVLNKAHIITVWPVEESEA